MKIKKKVTFSKRDKIKHLGKSIDEVLEALDSPSALVSDNSIVRDFISSDHMEIDKNNVITGVSEEGHRWLKGVSKKLGVEVGDRDYIWEIARAFQR